jgi:hypothetical protein
MMMAEFVSFRGFAGNEHEAASRAECTDVYRKDIHLFSYFACYATSAMIQLPPSSFRDLHMRVNETCCFLLTMFLAYIFAKMLPLRL